MGNNATSVGMASLGGAIGSILVYLLEIGVGRVTLNWVDAAGASERIKDIPQGIETAVVVAIIALFTRLMPASVPESMGMPPPKVSWLLALLLPLTMSCATLNIGSPVADYAAFDQAQVAYTNAVEFAVDDVMPSTVCDKKCDKLIVDIIEEANPAVNDADIISAKYKCHADVAGGLVVGTPCAPLVTDCTDEDGPRCDSFILDIGMQAARTARERLRRYIAQLELEERSK